MFFGSIPYHVDGFCSRVLDWIPTDFEDYIYVSQLLQAEGIITAIEAQRRAMPRCMGALYWQLNDCWPVTSWSSVDYYGNWKALHYFVKDAFEKTLVSPILENDNLNVYVISDETADFAAVLKMKLMDFDGKIFWEKETSSLIKGNRSGLYFKMPAIELLKNYDKSRLVFVTEISMKNKVIAKNLLYFEKPKNLALPVVNPEFQIEKINQGYRIFISGKSFIKNLYLEFPDIEGHFDRNFFDILPGEKAEVIFETKSEIPVENLKPVFRNLNRISGTSDN